MNIEDLYPFVLPELPDCPDATLRQAFVLTLLDFCQRTHAWNEIADAVRLVDGVAEYDIDYPSGATPETVSEVWCGPQELRPATMSRLSDELPDWQTATSTRPVYYNATGDWGAIQVYPKPAGVSQLATPPTLRLRGVFLPRLDTTTIPDFIAQRWLECITAGVKSRLMLQPSKVWSNEKLGAYHKGQYEELRGEARIVVLSERVPGTTTVRPVRFGG